MTLTFETHRLCAPGVRLEAEPPAARTPRRRILLSTGSQP